MLNQKALEILTYIRVSGNGRRWIDLENEFTQERNWPKGTFVKYWKEVKPLTEKKPDPKRPGRFRYFIRQEFENEPEKAILRRRINENKILAEDSITLPKTLKEKYLKVLGEVISENVYGNPFKAWDLIINIAKTTPPSIKERIMPYLKAAKGVYEKDMCLKTPPQKWRFVKGTIVPFLLDKFSSLLYED